MAFAYLDLRSVVLYSEGTVGMGYSYAYVYGGSCACVVPPCVDSCGSTGNGTASGLGGKLFAGVDVAPGLSFEASYEITPQINANSYNAVGVYLKYRF